MQQETDGYRKPGIHVDAEKPKREQIRRVCDLRKQQGAGRIPDENNEIRQQENA